MVLPYTTKQNGLLGLMFFISACFSLLHVASAEDAYNSSSFNIKQKEVNTNLKVKNLIDYCACISSVYIDPYRRFLKCFAVLFVPEYK